jgi:hypothetical protein
MLLRLSYLYIQRQEPPGVRRRRDVADHRPLGRASPPGVRADGARPGPPGPRVRAPGARAPPRRVHARRLLPPRKRRRRRSPAARGEEWMGETEWQRVRSVRERVRMATATQPQQRHNTSGEAPTSRGTRMAAMERQRELQGLSEQRAVSAFAHRARIQVKTTTFLLSFPVRGI